MHAILITYGSAGDVFPVIGLGRALRQRGVTVSLMTNEFFEPVARRAGLDFIGHGTAEQYDQITQHPDLWHPRRGLDVVLRAWASLVPETYAAIRDRYVPGQTVVVASAVALGARVAQEHLGVPLVTIHMQPVCFRSLYEAPLLPSVPAFVLRSRAAKRLMYRVGDWLVDRRLAEPVNRFRAELGLPPVRRLLNGWWHSPQRIVGLFPDWFAAPQPDWPLHVTLSGFPVYDTADDAPLPAEVAAFVAPDDPPIVFTPGTAMRHGRKFFQAAVEAARRLGRRAILLTRFPEQLPAPLPAHVRHFEFVPLGKLLPHCAAIVHHGSIGTTSGALAAGVPQLIMPMGFDQPDNAARAEALGVARSLSPRAFRPRAVADRLAELTGNPVVLVDCRRHAARTTDPTRLDAACDAILSTAGGGLKN